MWQLVIVRRCANQHAYRKHTHLEQTDNSMANQEERLIESLSFLMKKMSIKCMSSCTMVRKLNGSGQLGIWYLVW
jgi:hypothetical protein